jgi:hypothetical protein
MSVREVGDPYDAMHATLAPSRGTVEQQRLRPAAWDSITRMAEAGVDREYRRHRRSAYAGIFVGYAS